MEEKSDKEGSRKKRAVGNEGELLKYAMYMYENGLM